MTTKRAIERELRRGARLVATVHAELPRVLCALLAAGEHELAGRIASIMGTYGTAVLEPDLMAYVRSEAKLGARAALADSMRPAVLELLAKHGLTEADLAREVAAIRAAPKGRT